jgi:phage terminase large subunit-like protein
VASQKGDYPYRFDDAKAHRVCRFIEKLPHVKGKWAVPRRGESNNFMLQPWQIWIVCCIFGWVDKVTGFRRFNEAYIEVPRKNGKSMLAAAIGLVMLVMDNEHGAEVYSGATKEKQAKEVFRPAQLMVKRTPAIQRFFNIEVNAKSLTREDDGARFEPVVGNPGDGSSPSCAILDEVHEMKTPVLRETMVQGMGAREQALLLQITTAGTSTEGPCYLVRTECISVLGGLLN